MNRFLGAVMLATICLGSAGNSFADTNAQQNSPASPQQQCQVALLQKQVNALTGEVAALQAQADMPSPNENIIDNLATGG